MTTKILDAFKENKEKFDDIGRISREIKERIKMKEEVANKIMEIYRVVFKNFNTERKETPVRIKGIYSSEEERNVVFINKDGISLKEGAYMDNTSYIDTKGESNFCNLLKQLKLKESDLLPFVKENKKLIFKQFFEKVDLLCF